MKTYIIAEGDEEIFHFGIFFEPEIFEPHTFWARVGKKTKNITTQVNGNVLDIDSGRGVNIATLNQVWPRWIQLEVILING